MDDEDISKLDPDLIMARQLEELEKERKELQVRLLNLKWQRGTECL